jgi:UDP-N-acetylmuramate dehydrogenase
LLEPKDPDELVAALNAARERGVPVRVLGGGANLLVADGTLPGVVVATAALTRCFRPPHEDLEDEKLFELEDPAWTTLEPGEDPRLAAWAGVSLPGLVNRATELGWAGLECLGGVPGHLGGAIAMNAGGKDGWTWDVVRSVRVLEPDGSVRQLARAECSPGYRDGNLGERIVLGAVLELRTDRREDVQERTRDYIKRKNAVQPVSERSAGCVFKNPDAEVSGGLSAGQLVDRAGGLGLARGDAMISPLHGNFLVNRGAATAADVLGLIEEVRARVAEHSGIELELEVVVWDA